MRYLAGLLVAATLMAFPADAQQFQNVPDHTFIGRIGTGSSSGPSQAIPFSLVLTSIGITPACQPFLGTPSSANLRACVSDETGTGLAYFQGGALGTPSSGTLTNASGLPTTGLTGTLQAGQFPALTGDVTTAAGALATTLATVNSNVGSFGSGSQVAGFTVNAKGLITAASQTAVTPAISNVTGMGTGVATFLGAPTSANLAGALTDETGSGAAVFATGPTITSLNNVGVQNGSNAATGSVGEYLVTDIPQASAVSLTSGTSTNLASINLTAGDWDVWGTVFLKPAGTTNVTAAEAQIGSTSSTIGAADGVTTSYTAWPGGAVFGSNTPSLPPIMMRVSISTSTTYYLVVNAAFTVSTASMFGAMQARRVR